jgi:hypothetical protein
MNVKALASFSGALILFSSGVIEYAHGAEPKPPPSIELSSPVTTEEPRGVLSLRDVLSLVLLKNPDL